LQSSMAGIETFDTRVLDQITRVFKYLKYL
jgi:hypothetical protein